MEFSAIIAEQETCLQQLRLHGEYKEMSAQELVYEMVVEKEDALEFALDPNLPTDKHDVLSSFFDNISQPPPLRVHAEITLQENRRS